MIALLAAAALAASSPQAVVEERVSQGSDGATMLSHAIVAPVTEAAAWTAVATVEGWKCWAVPVALAQPGDGLTWETSYKPDAKAGDPANIVQRFRIVDAGRELAFQTIRTPPGFPHPEAMAKVENRFILAPAPGGTRIELKSGAYPGTEAGKMLSGFFTSGNRVSMKALLAYLNKGGGPSCPK